MNGQDEELADISFVAELWKELLRVDTVCMADDFYQLGGNSLLAIRLLVAISARLGKELEYEGFFASPTFETLNDLTVSARGK